VQPEEGDGDPVDPLQVAGLKRNLSTTLGIELLAFSEPNLVS
jgi:hypothetical protein